MPMTAAFNKDAPADAAPLPLCPGIRDMKPLSQLPLAAARSIRVVLTDIDDTVTTEGLLTAKAYGALEELHRAGFIVIPVTGRPAGWCDHIARM